MRPFVGIRLVSRRSLLRSGAGLVGATALGACDDVLFGHTPPPEDIEPITPNADYYVTSSSVPPVVDRDTWAVSIADGTQTIGQIDGALLDSLTPRETERTLECIGGGPGNQKISNAIWSGLPLPEVLAAAGVSFRTDALQIVMQGAEGYATSVPRADLDRPMWLVWKMNGEALPQTHGFPARLLVPGRYGMKNVKWLVSIGVIDVPFLGYWESRGWSDDATYLPNTLIHAPSDGISVEGGARLLGTAFCGEDPVISVEITDDGGATWQEAEITYQNGPGVWALWRFDWVAEPGDYTLQARCTTASGASSVASPFGTNWADGYDGSMAIDITVT